MNTYRKRCSLFIPCLLVAVTGCGREDPAPRAVMDTYADIAYAVYQDAWLGAVELQRGVDALLNSPDAGTHEAVKQAWLRARIPYGQSEVFRFGNPNVDAWEGRVNAWPLDEGLIDYVAASYGAESDENGLYTANVVANPMITIDGAEIDASAITADFLQDTLQEAGGIEANVATGYHAIEFLLWGQDLNGTDAGAGTRPASDFDTANCSNGNCDRRAAYLAAASDLLVADLEEIVGAWQDGGEARTSLAETGIATILTGMGSLSIGEVAGERMKLGLLLHDPEEEHDCFSDNTHISHLYDAVGVRNVYLGHYTRVDGSAVDGPSVSELIAARDAGLDGEIRALLDDTVAKMEAMAARADSVEAYDQMIGEGNEAGNAVVQAAIDGLIAQTRGIERAVALLELGDTVTIEDSDSLSNPDAVFE
jgi:putative iron-regulated protein